MSALGQDGAASVLSFLIALSFGALGCSHVSRGVACVAPESLRAPEPIACGTKTLTQCAEALRTTYGTRARAVVDEQTFLYDLPAIGIAIASAAILAFNGSDDLALSFGIAGGSLSVVRRFANSGGQATIYNTGERRAFCVEQQVEWFALNGNLNTAIDGARRQLVGPRAAGTPLLDDARGRLANHENGTAVIAPPELAQALASALKAGEAAAGLAERGVVAFSRNESTAKETIETIDTGIRKEIHSGRPDVAAITEAIKKQVEGLAKADQQSEAVDQANTQTAEMSAAALGIARVGVLALTPGVQQIVDEITKQSKIINDSAPRVIEEFEKIRACVAQT